MWRWWPVRGAVSLRASEKFAGEEFTAAGTRPRARRGPHNTDTDGPGAVPSSPQVLADNDLRQIAPLAKGERVMLERKKLDGFYRELQNTSRVKANTPRTQVEEYEEDPKSELTQS